MISIVNDREELPVDGFGAETEGAPSRSLLSRKGKGRESGPRREPKASEVQPGRVHASKAPPRPC